MTSWGRTLVDKSERILEQIGKVVAPIATNQQELEIAIRKHDWQKTAELLALEDIDMYGTSGKYDWSPLHMACACDFAQCVEYLLESGVDVDLRDRKCGETPLHHAARAGSMRVCKLLIERGASPAARNNRHQSPYDVASQLNLRQWILPLQLRAEGEAEDAAAHQFGPPPTMSQGVPLAPAVAMPPTSMPPPTSMSPASMPPTSNIQQTPPPMPAIPPRPPASTNPPRPPASANPLPFSPAHSVTAMQSAPPPAHPAALAAPPPPMPPPPVSVDPVPMQQQLPTPPAYPPPALRAAPPVAYSMSSTRKDALGRYADGFHSSSSDPVLAAKYGHSSSNTYTNIPPPPTGLPPPPTQFASPATSGYPGYTPPHASQPATSQAPQGVPNIGNFASPGGTQTFAP